MTPLQELLSVNRSIALNVRESSARFRANGKTINRILKVARAHAEKADSYLNVYPSCGWVYASFNLRGLDGFKSEALCSAIEALTDEGLVFDVSRENAAEVARDYRGQIDLGGDSRLVVTIYASVKSDSPTCRKVVVGSETVTVEKYAIECD